jgi:hypothetical protein
MYVAMCVIYVPMLCTYMCMCLYIWTICNYVCVYYVLVYVCMYLCTPMHVYACLCDYVCMSGFKVTWITFCCFTKHHSHVV